HKGHSDLAAQVRQEVQDHLRAQRLDPPGLLADLEAECSRMLSRAPQDIVAGWLEPVADPRTPWSFDLVRLRKVLGQIDQFLGPLRDEAAQHTATVPSALREVAEQIGTRGCGVLAGLFGYLERPGYRLAAAAEAVSQAAAHVERWLQMLDEQ